MGIEANSALPKSKMVKEINLYALMFAAQTGRSYYYQTKSN
jgi:hypothetical protein